MTAPSPAMRWLPNALTCSRALAGPVVFALVVGGTAPWMWWAALIIAITAEFTDVLDGWVARRLGATSQLGAALDPLSDSLYRLSVFSAFAITGLMPAWLLLVFVWRDIVVAYARIAGASRGVSVGARLSGKVKAVAQGAMQVGTLGLFAAWSSGWVGAPHAAVAGLALITAAITAWSLVDYVRGFVFAPHTTQKR